MNAAERLKHQRSYVIAILSRQPNLFQGNAYLIFFLSHRYECFGNEKKNRRKLSPKVSLYCKWLKYYISNSKKCLS